MGGVEKDKSRSAGGSGGKAAGSKAKSGGAKKEGATRGNLIDKSRGAKKTKAAPKKPVMR
ncbi:MAG TPA: hypothetical protein VJX67_14960 [Blastocatellia bacterium]|nr:hypothetical protein [Blastocatellia bacterium]